MFKRNIDLSAYAAARGYQLDKNKSSQRTRVMRLDGDKINISRTPDGHWLYYSCRNAQDSGSIIEFVVHRDHPQASKGHYPIGQVRQELRRWTHTERPLPEFARAPLQDTPKDLSQVEQMIARSHVRHSNGYLESRALSASTLSSPRFQGTWRVASGYFRDGQWKPLPGDRGNVLFPHYNTQGLCGYEAKNRAFTGFAPGGEKGLWTSRVRASDTELVIAESAIDAISFHSLRPHAHARYMSFAGQLNQHQPELLDRAIRRMQPGATIRAITDNDKDGHDYAFKIVALCDRHPHVSFARSLPSPDHGKDWNDQLREVVRDQDKGLSR